MTMSETEISKTLSSVIGRLLPRSFLKFIFERFQRVSLVLTDGFTEKKTCFVRTNETNQRKNLDFKSLF